MEYSKKQIENAKAKYSEFLQLQTASQDVNYNSNPFEAERQAEHHNNVVNKILSGDKELEREWKMFFLKEEVKQEQKLSDSKTKLNANKEASADILAPIKEIKKIGAFGKWLNTPNNPYRKQHFNKKYTSEAVNEFLKTI